MSDMVMELTGIGCVDVHKEYYVHSPVVVGKLNADVKNAPSMIMYGMYDVQPRSRWKNGLYRPMAERSKSIRPTANVLSPEV